jgi:DNA polymerase-1
MLEQLGLRARRVFDTMLAEQVIQGMGLSDGRKQGVEFNLRAVADSYGLPVSKEERNWFIGLDTRPDEWTAPFPPEQIEYMLQDVEVLEQIAVAQGEELTRRGLRQAAQLEMHCLPALVEMERAGVRVDVEGWRAVIQEKEAEALEIEGEVLAVFGPPILQARAERFDRAQDDYRLWELNRDAELARLRAEWDREHGAKEKGWGEWKQAGMSDWRKVHSNPGKPKFDTAPPNLGSVPQLMQAFYAFGIPVRSTESEFLEQIEDEYPAVALLLRWRRAQKFVDSFGESLLKHVGTDGRIHPDYVQIGASTDRMSCTKPNWQQIPSKGDGKRLRALVVAEPGNVILTADFSNIELRILADQSGDPTMLRLFSEGADLHSETARMMFKLAPDFDVKHETFKDTGQSYRAIAKVINFGLAYGMSPSKLARTVRVSREEAQELFESYFRLYPGVKAYLDGLRKSGVAKLCSKTASGWTRLYKLPPEPTFPFRNNNPQTRQAYNDAKSERRMLQARIERQAMNTPIQGTSAAITKQAMALWHERVNFPEHHDHAAINAYYGAARIIAVVHDELVVEVGDESTSSAADCLVWAMDQAQHKYLKRVTLPPPEVVVSDHWSKE